VLSLGYAYEDTIVTQASLSPDLQATIGNSPAEGQSRGAGSEAALWLFGLTSLALVFASLLLLALLAQRAVADAPLFGFFSATAVFAAAIGLGAMTYVVATARRAGYIRSEAAASSDAAGETPAGMRVVPATPADPARRKRSQRAQEQAARSRQASAIAAAAATRHTRQVAPRQAVARPVRPRSAAPTTAPVRASVEVRGPARAVPDPRPRVVVPVKPPAQASRPAPVRVFPRMPAAPVRPRTQVARTQLVAADVRARSMRPVSAPPPAARPVVRGPVSRPPMVRPLAARPPVARPPVNRVPVNRVPVNSVPLAPMVPTHA
jgi:hypothetical protein